MKSVAVPLSVLLLLIVSVSCFKLEDIEDSLWRPSAAAEVIAVNFTFDLSKETTEFLHVWEECVGSGHATLALRQDYREYLTKVHKDIGIKHVRFHAIFDDDMSTYTIINNVPATSFFNIDSIYDFLLKIGMKPYVELSFMPQLLASGNQTVFHYQGNITPPASYADWALFIQAFIKHLVERYGIDEVRTWPFEVWNEPNCGFWTGTQDEYYQFYKVTAEAIKSIDGLLLVGGPSTCQSQWLTSFLNFTESYNVPVDFVSTHEYPTDITPTTRDVLTGVVQTSRKEVGSLPLYYSEYNDGLYSPAYHDTPYAAAFAVKNAHDVAPYVNLWSWWTFSDIFEEQGFTSQPFYNVDGWGLLSRYSIAKPVYRAFQLLHNVGNQLLNVVTTTNSTSPLAQNLEAFATIKLAQGNKRVVDIVVYNFDVPNSVMANETAILQLVGVPGSLPPYGTLNLIDKYHANAPKKWLEMGKPAYPNKAELQELEIASYLQPTPISYERISNDIVQFTITLIPQSVAFITLDLD